MLRLCGGRRTEDGGWMTDDRRWWKIVEDEGQRTKDGGWMTEDAGRKTDDRGWRTEDRGPGRRPEDEGWRTERRKRAETEDGGCRRR